MTCLESALDYLRAGHLEAKANAPRYIEIVIWRVKAIVAGCKFRSIADISLGMIGRGAI
jgi:hypothetical protein